MTTDCRVGNLTVQSRQHLIEELGGATVRQFTTPLREQIHALWRGSLHSQQSPRRQGPYRMRHSAATGTSNEAPAGHRHSPKERVETPFPYILNTQSILAVLAD